MQWDRLRIHFCFYFFWKVFVMKIWLCRTISHALDPLVTGYLFSESSKCLSMMIADNTTWKNMTFIRNYIHISYNFVLYSLWNSFAIQNLPEYIFLTPFHCQQIRPSAQFSSKNRLLNVVKLFLKHQKILVFRYLYSFFPLYFREKSKHPNGIVSNLVDQNFNCLF